jgi:Tfp pilus assembly protein PilN
MSKVQFNLLPDIKIQYNEAQRLKNLVTTVCVLVAGGLLGLLILLTLTVDVVQKKQLTDSAKEVDKASQQLKSVPQIDQIITVQNQLKTLAQLHQSKHIPSRIFSFLPKLTPNDVTINNLTIDLKANTMAITGKANSQSSVNAFVDSLKFATYKTNGAPATKAFSSVVESAFSINQTNIAYTINLQFDPALFSNTVNSDGKPVGPTLSVSQPTTSSLSPGSTLFNSSQSSGGSQ